MATNPKHVEEILKELKDLSEEQISYLLQIIHIFKESLLCQKEHDFELKREFEEWDNLSDEAINNFEQVVT